MKRILLVALVCTAAVQAVQAQEVMSNGGMPPGFPPTIEVARVPMGSGIPSPGYTTGYSEATPVADGLYQVPGYLPYQSTASSLSPRVVDVRCTNQGGVWYCNGYHLDGVLMRGEDIYVRPEFVKVVVPGAPAVAQPVVFLATPVHTVYHARHFYKKVAPKVCK